MDTGNSHERFTVVEVLADIVVIVILAVIAIPVYLHGRRSSLRLRRIAPTSQPQLATVTDKAAA